jgi:ABC-type ATPase with predicted acetyltransferase domain
MPSFNIVKKTKISDSFRAKAIMGAFDLNKEFIEEKFIGNIDIENKEWNIGAIVGASGTGKTTIAKKLFNDLMFVDEDYSGDCVMDDMPPEKSIKDISLAFSSVGFGSPISWLKPYYVLSNGEKMRVDLAKALLKEDDVFAFDEYTSVVDRNVAKVGSLAIQKSIRKSEKKFIAISCHKDIIDWLKPDWIFDTDEMRFFFAKNQNSNLQSVLRYKKLNSKQKAGMFSKSITI